MRRTPFVTHLSSLVAATLLGLWLVAGSATAWAAEARFVPAASSATWAGGTVTVTFREEGVDAGAAASILVTATGSVDAFCTRDGAVLLSTHSSATVTDVSDYPVSPDGTVTATRELALEVRPPTVTGLDCTLHVVRTFSVLLRDVDTGATLHLPHGGS